MTWYDAGYVIEKYNEESSDSYHENVALAFKELLDRATKEIEKQDRELALAKKLREERRKNYTEEEPEIIH